MLEGRDAIDAEKDRGAHSDAVRRRHVSPLLVTGHHLPILPLQNMLQAAFRSPAARSFAYQSVRALASKPPPPPKNVNANRQQTPPTNPPPPPSPSGADSKDPQQPFAGSSVIPSLDFDPEGPEAGGAGAGRERTGAKSSKDSLSSIERRRRFLGRVSLAMILAGAGAVTWVAGRPWEEDELKAKKLVSCITFPSSSI